MLVAVIITARLATVSRSSRLAPHLVVAIAFIIVLMIQQSTISEQGEVVTTDRRNETRATWRSDRELSYDGCARSISKCEVSERTCQLFSQFHVKGRPPRLDNSWGEIRFGFRPIFANFVNNGN